MYNVTKLYQFSTPAEWPVPCESSGTLVWPRGDRCLPPWLSAGWLHPAPDRHLRHPRHDRPQADPQPTDKHWGDPGQRNRRASSSVPPWQLLTRPSWHGLHRWECTKLQSTVLICRTSFKNLFLVVSMSAAKQYSILYLKTQTSFVGLTPYKQQINLKVCISSHKQDLFF